MPPQVTRVAYKTPCMFPHEASSLRISMTIVEETAVSSTIWTPIYWPEIIDYNIKIYII